LNKINEMYPSYLKLSKKDLKERVEKLFEILKNCEICPRKCHVNRLKGEKGYCQLGYLPGVSAYHPHFGEESVLVGRYGSGTCFMTSCNLSCVYCQNYEISQLRMGKEVSFEELAEMMIELQNLGCHNINFVTPTPQVPAILKSLEIAIERGLKIPLVYNTNSYDSVEVLKLLDGIFDIYLPDAKYSNDEVAQKYSNAPNYFKIMKSAIKEMHRQVGDLIINSKFKNQNAKLKFKIQNFEKIQKEFPEGVALRGLIVRHLVLPNGLAGSEKVFEFIAKEISKNTFINIMDQYWPAYKAHQYPELSRKITDEEFQEAINLAKKFGLKRIYY
jgi:putative pyruvate formate lyase activating enzyme